MSSALAQVAKQENASVFIISNSNTGKCIGPRLSIDLDASYISNVVETPSESSPITIKKKAFSGKAFEMHRHSSRCVLALSPNAYTITETKSQLPKILSTLL